MQRSKKTLKMFIFRIFRCVLFKGVSLYIHKNNVSRYFKELNKKMITENNSFVLIFSKLFNSRSIIFSVITYVINYISPRLRTFIMHINFFFIKRPYLIVVLSFIFNVYSPYHTFSECYHFGTNYFLLLKYLMSSKKHLKKIDLKQKQRNLKKILLKTKMYVNTYNIST